MALPSGYKRLLYIRSSGTQYINTEFNPKYNTRVVMKISDVDTSIDNQWFFGARDGTTASINDRFTLYKIGETVRSDYFGTSVTVDVSDFTGSTTLDKNGNVASVYGETITNTAVSSGACAYPLFLFVLNNAGTPHSNYARYSLESCQIYDNGTLVRNFIPCTNASGTVGLWDDVNSKFYANAGTGTFTAGPAITMPPDGYTQLAYIQSSGTQFVNSKVKPNQDTRVVIEAEYANTTAATYLFGADGGSGISGFAFGSVNSKLRQFYNTASTYFADGLSFNSAIMVDANKNVATINNAHTVTGTYASFSCSYPMYLFADNRAGEIYGICSAKIYSCKIYDNGTLVRYFIPFKNASGTVGLWDGVNGVFYENAGTGSFDAGPEVDSGGSEGRSYKVTITGTGDSGYTYVIIGGTKYYSATEVSVPEGAEITFGQLGSFSTLTINGETISSTEDYTILATSDVEVALTFTWSGIKGTITVTLVNPLLPHDGHNTNVDNLAREIEGGTVNIGGVAYELECGFVLVGGVSREIPFGPQTANVTITGSGLTRAWVTIDGKKYTGAATVEVPKGTALVASCTAATAIETYITLNGKTVKTGSGTIAYSMTVEEDTAVKLIGSEKLAGTYYRGRVEITTG